MIRSWWSWSTTSGRHRSTAQCIRLLHGVWLVSQYAPTMTLRMASSCQQEGIWPDTTILWSGSTSTCWGHSHTDTDKVGIRGKAVSSPETTVPYQLSQHYATVEPVFLQGDHYNSTAKEMCAYQRSSFRPLNFRNILYCLYWHKYVMFL